VIERPSSGPRSRRLERRCWCCRPLVRPGPFRWPVRNRLGHHVELPVDLVPRKTFAGRGGRPSSRKRCLRPYRLIACHPRDHFLHQCRSEVNRQAQRLNFLADEFFSHPVPPDRERRGTSSREHREIISHGDELHVRRCFGGRLGPGVAPAVMAEINGTPNGVYLSGCC